MVLTIFFLVNYQIGICFVTLNNLSAVPFTQLFLRGDQSTLSVDLVHHTDFYPTNFTNQSAQNQTI